MDLIQEAKKRGYRKGVLIRYNSHSTDRVEGNYFEIKEGDLVAYSKPRHERNGFDDWRFDTLYDSKSNKWTEIVK